jgi:methionyl-tRNA formyltransferase
MYKICFLFDTKNNWIKNKIKKSFKSSYKYKFFFSENFKRVKNYDVVFILGYTRILKNSFLKNNKLNLVIHESKLPRGKGFAPVQWQILDNKNKIPICIIEAKSKFDSGNIYIKKYFDIKSTDLYDQIRESQGNATVKIIKDFLKYYPKVKSKPQKGKSTYFKKREKKNSEISINKSLRSQFNILRISNNDSWPSFFYFKGIKYILKIEKE